LRTTASDDELLRAGADWIVDDCSSVSLQSPDEKGDLVLTLSASHAKHR
jgi:hypothetical protein